MRNQAPSQGPRTTSRRLADPKPHRRGPPHHRPCAIPSADRSTEPRSLSNQTVRLHLLPLVVLSVVHAPLSGSTQVLPGALAILALLTALCLWLDKKDMVASLRSLFDSTHQLISQIEMNHNNAVLTSEIGHSISRRSGSVDVLSNVVKACKKWLDYDRCMILLADTGGKRLVFGAGYGHDERASKL